MNKLQLSLMKYISQMQKLFDNTEVAFALKSNSQLDRALYLFKLIQQEPLVKIGAAVAKFALKTQLPIEPRNR